MLNSETKRHIDAARDVLVGVAPNPTTQIDQITYALIYKFMDDMDQAAIKVGGNPSFFTGDLEPYAWSKLSNSRMGNQEKMNLYSEALTKFSEAKQLPELFRVIFKAALLPYRSPETLGLFLKEISYFDYSHPEELGNAYEYLLSIMSSQGDAGQFRTPRHIINFIVEVINPTKDDRVLDPACGTAGFLVSSYNHILKQHDGKDDPKKKEKPLTPDERKKLMQNFHGYDIDPTMVRIAQVNTYLHQFKNPQIFQYDTLTSEEMWSEKFDVILANPPFMTPKGGIKPHNKFSIPSNRAEVLFVDYIVNHLRPKGRAGIIVPEGVIFQSGNAYKTLRKNLVENGLFAVVSLPSGVFQPYSGVKTSILFFDNEIAKQKSDIAFIKISADGYDLGSTKREISKNDLPLAIETLEAFANETLIENSILTLVKKQEIANNGDYNLTGEKYKLNFDIRSSHWPLVKLDAIAEILNGYAFKSDLYTNEGIRVIRITNVQKGFVKDDEPKYYPVESSEEISKYLLHQDDLLISLTGNVGRVALLPSKFLPAALNQRVACIRIEDENVISKKYLFHILNLDSFEKECISASSGVAQKNLSTDWLKSFEIPIPPQVVQEQIVAELDGYAAIISAAKQIVDNWKPNIEVDSLWKKVELSEVCQFINGDRGSNYPTNRTQINSGIPFINAGNLSEGKISLLNADFISEEQFIKIGGGKIEKNDVLFCLRGSLGKMAINTELDKGAIASSLIILRAKLEKVLPLYLYTVLASDIGQSQIAGHQTGAAQPNLAAGNLKEFLIPLPELEIQQDIVEKILIEQSLIDSAKQLTHLYESKTQAVIAKLWKNK